MFASLWWQLIAFLLAISEFTIARVLGLDLGSFYTGEIGPQEGHHDAQQAKAT